MIYAAMTFWLLVIVLTAWGVHRLWGGMVKPKVFNTALLPGTLVAQLGHVVGLLVTGATISNTTLIKNDESGDPEATPNPEPRIPVVGPVIIGMLPILACALGIFFLARYLGGPILTNMYSKGVAVPAPVMPTTMAGIWQLLRDQITLVESMVAAITSADLTDWKVWLFLYLLICLSIRIAPFRGYLRGSVAAIILLGIAAAMLSRLFGMADPRVQSAWATMNLTVGTLLLLLMISLLVRGAIGLVRILRDDE
jgi:hypothetical protein